MAAFTPTLNPRPQVAYGAGADDAVLVAAGPYTATASQEFAVLSEAAALELTINYVKTGAAPSVVFTVERFDIASNTFVPVLVSAAVVATSVVQLLVGNSVPNVANVSQAHCLGRVMRVTATHGNTDIATYSIGCVSNDD